MKCIKDFLLEAKVKNKIQDFDIVSLLAATLRDGEDHLPQEVIDMVIRVVAGGENKLSEKDDKDLCGMVEDFYKYYKSVKDKLDYFNIKTDEDAKEFDTAANKLMGMLGEFSKKFKSIYNDNL